MFSDLLSTNIIFMIFVFHVKIQPLVTAKCDQARPDPHWGKKLDPDPHWNQCYYRSRKRYQNYARRTTAACFNPFCGAWVRYPEDEEVVPEHLLGLQHLLPGEGEVAPPLPLLGGHGCRYWLHHRLNRRKKSKTLYSGQNDTIKGALLTAPQAKQ